MSERLDIAAREVTGSRPNPPSLLSRLREIILQVFADVAESGGSWLKGRGDQETAKAGEIRAATLEKVEGLEHDRLRLIQERDALLLKVTSEQERDRMAHEQKMYELKTQRIKEVVVALQTLKDLGVTLDAKTKKALGMQVLGSLPEEE